MYERAMFVARTFKVKTGRDRAFLATEKYMSEKRSDWAAFQSANRANQSANRAKVRFEETPCAKELKSLELDKSKELTPEQVAEIRRTAKRRFLQAVTGNLVVLAAEDEGESEFVRYELPLILQAAGIRRINDRAKEEFAARYNRQS